MRAGKSRHRIIFLFAGIALAGFTLLRALLVAANWSEIGHSAKVLLYIFTVGLTYDVAFIIYFSLFFSFILLVLPERFYKSRLNSYFLTPAIAFLLLYGFYFTLLAEWFFWDEFHTRFNFIAIDYLVYCHEVTRNIYESYPLFPLLSGVFLAAAASLWGIGKRLREYLAITEPRSHRAVWSAVLAIATVAVYFLVGQPLHEQSLNNYCNELAANGPYQMVAAFRNNELDYRCFYALGDDLRLSRRLKKLVVQGNSHLLHHGGLYDLERMTVNPGPEKRMNVFLVTVESLSARYLKRFGERRNITPFMDRWFRQGLFFTNFYATGTRTVRGLEAISLSFPPTPGRSLIKRPESPGFQTLGEVFARRGYDVAFIYGGRGFFDNMNSFFSRHGYRCVDQGDFSGEEKTFSNAWGLCDEDLFARALVEADRDHERGRPFFFQLMTTSNHKPFTYPPGRIDIPSGHGRSGGVKYTDYALRKFISAAKTKPWFANTVFVVVADHCAHSAGRAGLPVARYHIPLFFYAPALIPPGEIDKLSSQIDLAPTLLGLLHISCRNAFFGGDVRRPDFHSRALIANYVKLGLLEDDRLMVLSIHRQITEQKKPYCESARVRGRSGLLSDCQAFYQGADYVVRNKVNAVR